ncbi:MAG: hypothetical protein ACTHK4_10695 [Mycobacteriales bacterium]
MTEPMRDALSSLQDHLPTMDAVRDHIPSVDSVRDHIPSLKDVDASAITKRVRSRASGKWSIAALLAGLAAGAGVVAAYMRRHREPAYSASMYTPPLPKP